MNSNTNPTQIIKYDHWHVAEPQRIELNTQSQDERGTKPIQKSRLYYSKSTGIHWSKFIICLSACVYDREYCVIFAFVETELRCCILSSNVK